MSWPDLMGSLFSAKKAGKHCVGLGVMPTPPKLGFYSSGSGCTGDLRALPRWGTGVMGEIGCASGEHPFSPCRRPVVSGPRDQRSSEEPECGSDLLLDRKGEEM